MTVSALVVDDHQLLACSLSLALRYEGVSCTVADLDDPAGLVRAVVEAPPDLVLLDLDLGGAIGCGSTLVEPFVAAGCRVLVVTASADPVRIAKVLQLGATAVVDKKFPFESLLEVALRASRGEEVMSRGDRLHAIGLGTRMTQQRASALAPFEELSPREADVLDALMEGVPVSGIAARSFVSEATVRTQVRGVLTKLGVTSQLEAVAAAHRSGWLPRREQP